MRKPFGFISSELIHVLKGALERGDPIDISPKGTHPDQFVVRCKIPPQGNTYLFTIDASKEWLPVFEEVYGENGIGLKSKELTYRSTRHGWLPSEGSYRKLVEDVIPRGETEIRLPRKEWRFECLEMSVNDSEFSGEVFELVIPPHAYVYDSRFGVDYRVGEEGAAAHDLERLASEAEESQALDPSANPLRQALKESLERTEPAPVFQPRPRTMHVWVLATNVFLLSTVAVVFVVRRRRIGRNRPPTR